MHKMILDLMLGHTCNHDQNGTYVIETPDMTFTIKANILNRDEFDEGSEHYLRFEIESFTWEA